MDESACTERVINGSDNSTIIVGEARFGIDPDGVGIIRKVDDSGIDVWRYHHLLPDTSLRYYDVLLIDDEYYILGIADNNSYLRRMSENNELLDYANLGGDTTLWLRSMTELNGQLALTGSGNASGGNGSDVAYLVIDEDLDVEVVELYGGEASDSGTSCITTLDGNVLISGRTRSFNPNENREAYFLLLDSSGQMVTSITDFDPDIDLEVKIYPNPIDRGRFLSIESGLSYSSWQIIDIQGQELTSGIISSNQHSIFQIPIQNLTTGYYFLRLVADGFDWTQYPFVIK
jgi:hypothetical protein